MFKEINFNETQKDIFDMIGKEYLLISANDSKNNNNIMTASWGMAGILWNQPVIQIFVRPQRYTHDFLLNGDKFSICVFPHELKNKIHSICGSKSGRDIDKIKETGITPIFDNGYTYFDEAQTVFMCEKIYVDKIDPSGFIDPKIENNYNGDYHTSFIGRIVKVLQK